MTSLEDRRLALDQAAELYDRHRPGYPEALVDDVVGWSGIPERGRVLEIGCGTGQATASFARRDYRMICLEPGRNLVRIAVAKLGGFPEVHIETCRFEDWPRDPASTGDVEGSFDLVFAAQAFHFVDPLAGPLKIARVLRPGGAIALFANHPRREGSELHDRIQEIYRRLVPSLVAPGRDSWYRERIEASGRFDTPIESDYPWRRDYAALDYVGLMSSQSPHRLLPAEQRQALLDAIGEAIERAGGSITIEYVAHLVLARSRVE